MLTVVDHPLVQHKLTLMRSREIRFPDFRRLMREITLVLGVEATRDLPLERVTVETPNAWAEGARLRNSDIVIVPILRAGLIMAETLHELLPMARAGHLGLYRDHNAQQSRHISYLFLTRRTPTS